MDRQGCFFMLAANSRHMRRVMCSLTSSSGFAPAGYSGSGEKLVFAVRCARTNA